MGDAKRILVVEDMAIVARDLQQTLQRLGYSVPCTARSSEDALRAIEESPPDLVLMDIKLKGPVDGIETAARIRERWDIPVVYLTSHSDEGTLQRAKATGPLGYLLKPFQERDLRTTVEVALHKHELESRLAARERWFSTTLRSIGDAVIAADRDERVTFLNGAAEALTGWSSADAAGRKLSEVLRLVDADGRRLGSPAGRCLRDRLRVELPPNTQLLAREGERRDVDDSAAPIVDDRGEVIGVVVAFRDVTERKALEQRLARSERLASLGTLAAGMAHEINNPLAIIVADAWLVREALKHAQEALARAPGAAGTREEVRGALDTLSDLSEAADRIRRIVQDIRRFVQADRAERQVLDLPEVVDAAVRMTEPILRHSAVVVRDYGTTPFVEANEGQLVQVFTNLLTNAAQAIGEGAASSNRVEVVTRTDAGGRATVEVRDTGRGIAKRDLPRVFDPFFTTKPVGQGMGLGLTICHGIVASLGGEITVESEPGRGTTFRVALPPTPRRAEATEASTTAEAPLARRGRVLVIDDEPLIGEVLVDVLSARHDVVAETDTREALARVAAGADFDVIFCDLMMPDMSGIDFYEALRAAHPDAAGRVVFLTGGAVSPRAQAFLRDVSAPVISKPFQVAELLSTVHARVPKAAG